jgi:hypothetical protein
MARTRLDSWKEIAAYLKRDVTTVRRWEKREGLPVHRHLHDKLGSVYAFTDEIDAWSDRRRASAESLPSPGETIAGNGNDITHLAWRRWPLLAIPLLLAVGAAIMVLSFKSRARTTEATSPFDVAIVPPGGATVTSMALAPGGDQVAISGFRSAESPRLWIRRLDSIASTELAGTEGASFPFWSPGGDHLGFFAEGKLKTISLSTREVRELADAEDARGGTWNENGVILFAPAGDGAIYRIPESGGQAARVTTVHGRPTFAHAWPEFLPGGRRFLYLDMSRHGRHGIFVGDIDTGAIKRLVEVYSSAGFSTDGYLLFARDHLFAQRFDPESLELTGEPVMVADQVLTHYVWNHKADFSIARNGRLAVRRGMDAQNRMVWVDRRGREIGSLTDAFGYSNPAISPDGTRAAVTVYPTTRPDLANLWLFNLPTLEASRLTLSAAVDLAPVWSADGERLMFLSDRSGRMELFERPALAAGEDTRAPHTWPAAPGIPVPESWSPDGRYLTYSATHAKTKDDVWLLELHGERKRKPLLQSDANETQSQVSPDGRFIAYASDESGRFEVHVQTFPKPGQQWQVSAKGGADPRWRGDGRELFYVSSDRKLMAVEVVPGSPPRYGVPRELFPTGIKYLWQDTRNHYDVSPDGRHFLLLVPRADPQSGSYTLIVNWNAPLSASSASR